MAEGLEVPHSDINYSDPILTSLEPTAERVFVNNSSSDATVNILKANGFKAKAVPTSSGAGFTEAIVIQKEAPSGKTVRVYRGVNQSDVSVLKQIPYAMRADSEDSYGSVTLDNVRQEVETLAEDPSYEHLLAYADKIRPQIIESQKKKLDESLTEIEDGVLRGRSVRRLLAFDQIKHGGGNLDSGVSPYVSASFNLREALKYTHEDGVLLVMDVPISQIEDLNSDESETNIKGIIDARYITAIIPRDGSILRDDQAGMQAIDAMLQTVSETAQIPAYDPEETKLVRENQLASNQEKDRKQLALMGKRSNSFFLKTLPASMNHLEP